MTELFTNIILGEVAISLAVVIWFFIKLVRDL